MKNAKSSCLVLIAFNRPDLLRAQLELVKEHFDGKVFAIVDGPRQNRPEDFARVNEVCELFHELSSRFDVTINRSLGNLGCYRRIKSGLDWVFEQTDRAIILEDDCMPSPQFFEFASEMLDRYAEDSRIYSVSGTNLFPQLSPLDQSYFFSRYHNCWGWATWARAWKDFIDDPEEGKKVGRSSTFRGSFRNLRSFLYWRRLLGRTYEGRINSWAYRWMFSCWMQNGLSIHANVNLISNVGDGVGATRTMKSKETRRPVSELTRPLVHPCYVIAHQPYDQTFEDVVFSKNFKNRILWGTRRISQAFRT